MTTLREFGRQASFSLDQYLTRAVKWLILANLAVFLIHQFLFKSFGLSPWFIDTFAQNPIVEFESAAGGETKINWLCTLQFFTYMFIHDGFWHLFVNMLGLWFFGPMLELRWGTAAFAKFYLFTGFMAGVAHGLLAPFVASVGPVYSMYGASGAVFGVLIAFGLSFPRQQVLLFFLFPMPAIVLVVIYGLLAFSAMAEGVRSNISHLTHLAGFGFGFLWMWLHDRTGKSLWLFNDDPGPFRRLGRGRGGGYGGRYSDL